MNSVAMEQNLRRYVWYVALRDTYVWMPVFFLYFQSLLSLEQVLLLEALYYISVVLMEVPSGYLSDRLGRRPILILSSLTYVLGYIALGSGHFWGLAAGQVTLAIAIALNSGTDTSFHYDTLKSLGRTQEYGDREAQLGKISAWSQSIGAMCGGGLACFWLGAPYWLAAALAIGMLLLAISFKTPTTSPSETRDFGQQLRACFKLLTRSPLRWIFVVAVVAVMLNHVPYEFYQSYIKASLQWGDVARWGRWAPLVAGIHVTVVWWLSGFVAARSVKWAERYGVVRVLIASLWIQLLIVLVMGMVIHPLVVVLLIGRGVAGGLQRAPIRSFLGPRVPQEIRATYLSIQSLAGRLGYALLLVILSASMFEVLSQKILLAAAILGACVILVGLWSLRWPVEGVEK